MKIDWKNIAKYNKQELYDRGFKQADDPKHGLVLMLVPPHLYDKIPSGTRFMDVMGKIEIFKKGTSDDDSRFGALPYGVVTKEMKIKR